MIKMGDQDYKDLLQYMQNQNSINLEVARSFVEVARKLKLTDDAALLKQIQLMLDHSRNQIDRVGKIIDRINEQGVDIES